MATRSITTQQGGHRLTILISITSVLVLWILIRIQGKETHEPSRIRILYTPSVSRLAVVVHGASSLTESPAFNMGDQPNIRPNFTGQWIVYKNENFEEFLRANGRLYSDHSLH